MKNILKKIPLKKLIKWVVIFIVLTIIGNIVYNQVFANRSVPTASEVTSTTEKVEVRDIQTILSSSGTIEPLNTYEVSTLVEGEVISADFEEGDYVEEGQVLYQIATDNLDTKIETAETSVTRAEKSYDKAVENYDKAEENYREALEDYEDAVAEYGDPNFIATETGIVKTLYVEEGDNIQNGSQIAQVYDNSVMLLEIPFSAAEIDQSLVGKDAQVVMGNSFETLDGKVTKVSNITEVFSGNRVMKQVTIQVDNPGGLTEESAATAIVADLYSSGEGTFQVLTDAVITADISGEIGELMIEEGSQITVGDIILALNDESIEEQLDAYKSQVDNAEDTMENAKDNVESAQEAIEDAETSLQEEIDSRDDYSITAPISGQIIRKQALAGDTINSNSTLCIIYDLSCVTFEMYVDELDVMSVKDGQEVEVSADAFEGVEINGVVTNISLESSASQGVTQYPVTIKIDDIGDLLPGMNVTGEIIIEKVEGVLAIPSEALMRGDVVYVADDTVTEAVGSVPAGFTEVAVETGITDGDYIEIVSGLTGEEEIYLERISDASVTMMQNMPGGDFGGFEMNDTAERGARPEGGGMQFGQ